MNDQSHLLMSLSYTPDDPRVPEEMRKASARIAQLEAALRWYEEKTHLIAQLEAALRWYEEKTHLVRLIHSKSDPDRAALAADGGAKARAALGEDCT